MITMELDKILDEMESIIMEATRVPLMDKIMVDEGELTMVMDKLRAAVPLEVKRLMICWKNRKILSLTLVLKQTILWSRLKRKATDWLN